MITNGTYAEARANTTWMLRCVTATKRRDLSNVNIFIAPSTGITALRGENPAIYVRNRQMDIAVNNWRREMQEYAGKHPAEIVPYDLIAKGTCIIVSEKVFTWPLMRRCGVLWHEYGHAYNEAVGHANTEQNAYLFEVEMIDWASTSNVFRNNGIRVADVLQYLDWRQPQFDMGKTPELTKLLESLRAKLAAMRQHGFMPA
jgi:hypothetical protein